jgi:hypothetical protein
MMEKNRTPKKQYYKNAAETVIKNLKKRRMEGYYCETKEEAVALALSLMPKGSSIGWGGSLLSCNFLNTHVSPNKITAPKAQAKNPVKPKAVAKGTASPTAIAESIEKKIRKNLYIKISLCTSLIYYIYNIVSRARA